jgi:O-methyltransferase involved in polyketide biosynthesis
MVEFGPAGIDTTQPNVARVYDYWLGGKDNFAADRDLAEKLLAMVPEMPVWVRNNREFVRTAAARAAREGGITQFLDLGAGLPARPAVHEAVRDVHPSARVVYVDHDPVVVRHAQALLARGAGLVAFQSDLTSPGDVLGHPELAAALDLDQPVAVIVGAVAHFLPADVMAATMAAYVSRISPGSWLILSAARSEEEELMEAGRAYTAAQSYRHSHEDFASFFAGTELVPPGIGESRRWIAGLGGPVPRTGLYVLGGAGVKRLAVNGQSS